MPSSVQLSSSGLAPGPISSRHSCRRSTLTVPVTAVPTGTGAPGMGVAMATAGRPSLSSSGATGMKTSSSSGGSSTSSRARSAFQSGSRTKRRSSRKRPGVSAVASRPLRVSTTAGSHWSSYSTSVRTHASTSWSQPPARVRSVAGVANSRRSTLSGWSVAKSSMRSMRPRRSRKPW